MSKWLSVRVQAVLALVLATTFGLAGQAQARWLRAETNLFVVYSDGNEQALRDFAVKLNVFDGILRAYTGVDPTKPVLRRLDIYLVKDSKDLRRISPKLGPSVGGFYASNLDANYAVAIRSNEDVASRDDVLFHEYTHHFSAQHFSYPYPAWLVEGWAEFYGSVNINAQTVEVGRPNPGRATTLLYGTWLPLQDLLGKNVGGVKDAGMFYAQSWLLTHYMIADTARRGQLAAYVRAVGAGGNPVQAMEVATGGSLADLDKSLRAYSRGAINYAREPRKPNTTTVTVSALPPSVDELLLDTQRLKSLGEKDEAAELLSEIRRKAAKFPGDRFAELSLARAELRLGDRAAGEQILRRYVTGEAPDAEALQLLGISRAATGANAEARTLLAKADQVHPDDYRTLYAYALTRSQDRDYPTDNTLNMLLLAYELAPQIADVTMTTAQALAARGRFDEAELLARRIANDPHGGPNSASAQTVLEQIAAMRASGGGRP